MRVQNSKTFGLCDVCRQEFLCRCVRFGGCSAQHRIHQRGRRTLPRELYHLDRFVHRGPRRNFVQESKLVDTQAQRERHRQIQPLDRLLQMPLEQKIKQPPPPQHAHREPGCERCVRQFYIGPKLGMQHVARVRAFCFDAAQNFIGNLPGWANGHCVPSKHRTRGKWKKRK